MQKVPKRNMKTSFIFLFEKVGTSVFISTENPKEKRKKKKKRTHRTITLKENLQKKKKRVKTTKMVRETSIKQ